MGTLLLREMVLMLPHSLYVMHYEQRQVELKSAQIFQSKMIREHMAVSKEKSHDCKEAGLCSCRIEHFSFTQA